MADRPKALDLFCGAGGASMGLHRAGFDVTGVDINRQPRYPFRFIQADALTFPLDGYDFIWASPPCQLHSNLNALWQREYLDAIPTMRERLERAGCDYVIENVVGAPLQNWVMLCGTMFSLKVFRHRLFESNRLLLVPPHCKHDGSTGTHRWPPKPVGGYVQVTGHMFNLTVASAAMGIDWMNRAELAESIPPAYSEFLGAQVLSQLMAA